MSTPSASMSANSGTPLPTISSANSANHLPNKAVIARVSSSQPASSSLATTFSNTNCPNNETTTNLDRCMNTTSQASTTNSKNSNSSNNSNVQVPQKLSPIRKPSPKDYMFTSLIGEGSYSSVMLATDIRTKIQYAVKICEKEYIRKEKKHDAIMREKQIMHLLNSHRSPFFVELKCTFQDEQRLYFVMNYARNGELLPYIKKMGSFDETCTRFYAAEILLALEHLHRLGIIHRDLKPENILLNERMHVQITDFGSAYQQQPGEEEEEKVEEETKEKVVKKSNENQDELKMTTEERKNAAKLMRRGLNGRSESGETRRRNSFVGTAQYVSPEMLTSKKACRASDLWALGCIIYQMTSGLPPFRAANEYLIFQKVIKLDYEFPNGFHPAIKNLIQQLLRLLPQERLGATDKLWLDSDKKRPCGYNSIRDHPFFKPLDNKWDTLHLQDAPQILPFLPKNSNSEELRSEIACLPADQVEPGLNDRQLTRLLGLALYEEQVTQKTILDIPPVEFAQKLRRQQDENEWHQFVDNNLILKQGLIDKRKGLFSRRRMFLLTTGPHLFYVDPEARVRKGEIPWSACMRTESKNFKTFFVHTPKRIYYLEDPDGFAPDWCKIIEEVRRAAFCKNLAKNA